MKHSATGKHRAPPEFVIYFHLSLAGGKFCPAAVPMSV
uniref:Uncharacterized protein n=1 Tax=Anguilla anguilla TaxID=7936 RepID=A0A0E9XZI9_ANGAN